MGTVAARCITALLLVFLIGCGGTSVESLRSQDEPLNVVISADPEIFIAGTEVTVTVTAANPTGSLIEFGRGSSSCQLAAVILVAGEEHPMPPSRACYRDYVVQELGPGEQRTESWIWRGGILVDGKLEPLPAGTYEIRGVAGSFFGAPLAVEIAD